jgi:hypothetical protein
MILLITGEVISRRDNQPMRAFTSITGAVLIIAIENAIARLTRSSMRPRDFACRAFVRPLRRAPRSRTKRALTAHDDCRGESTSLNHAWKTGQVTSDEAWHGVGPFRVVETARVRYLSQAECLRLVNGPAFTLRVTANG